MSVISCSKRDDGIRKAKTRLFLVLDAAHGGPDIGVVASNGLKERDIVLDFCNSMAAISNQYNIETKLTRTDTNAVTADSRVATSNNNNTDVFLSIHINRKPPVAGYEIMVAPGSIKYAESNRLAVLLKSAFEKNSKSTRTTEKGVYVLANNTKPALAIECGDVEDATDLAYFTEKEKRERLCRVMLETIVTYANSQ